MNTTKFKISARSAWDTVEIGPFDTREQAEQCCDESNWPFSLVKEFKPLPEVDTFEAKINTTFKKEWAQSDFLTVENRLLTHLKAKKYGFIAAHGEQPKPFVPQSRKQVSDLLGLAYTSSSDFAAYWVCNSGYLMADDDHNFIGFAINTDGQVVGIADDENEISKFILIN